MSRVGKKPITIPRQVQIEISGNRVGVRGPKGEIFQDIPEGLLVEQKEGIIIVSPQRNSNKVAALWGLIRALLQNHVKGVSEGFEKRLEIIGVGYKAAIEGTNKLKLEVGFSHSVFLDIPDDLKVAVEKNIIIVSGCDRQKVGELSAKIRRVRPPEPYKGKGIRYLGEKVRRKEGKKAATTK